MLSETFLVQPHTASPRAAALTSVSIPTGMPKIVQQWMSEGLINSDADTALRDMLAYGEEGVNLLW